MTARILKVNQIEYLNDPCKTPSLTASIANTIVSKSPLHAWSEHPKLGGKPEEPTKETDIGEIIHKLILGVGRDVLECPYPDWRTQAARTERDAIRASGKIPILSHKMKELDEIADAIKERLDKEEIDFPGEVECVIEWEETASDGSAVLCRCSMDHAMLELGQIDDLKTSSVSVHPRILSRWADAYGWHIKNAAYISALEHLRPELVGRVKPLRFVCAETIPPHDVVAGRLDATFREMGHRYWKRAIDEWARCLRTKEWPGYASGEITIEAPGWAMSQMMEEEHERDILEEEQLKEWSHGKEDAHF